MALTLCENVSSFVKMFTPSSHPLPNFFSFFLFLFSLPFSLSLAQVMLNSHETPSKMSHLEELCNETLYIVVLMQCLLVTVTVICQEVYVKNYVSDPDE